MMEEPPIGELRKHVRMPVKLYPEVNIRPAKDSQGIFTGNIIEISEGGVLIQLQNFDIASYVSPLKEYPFPPSLAATLKEYKLWLQFTLPEQYVQIKALAQPVHAQNNYHLAFQFIHLPDSDRKRIREFVLSKK
jgi:hypothetical protein